MSAPRIGFIGFIGFGEAASAIAKGLKGEGVSDIAAFDVQAIEDRSAGVGVDVVETPGELAQRTDIIFSAVVAKAAVGAAESIASDLTAHHLYVDLNSASPAVKQEVARIIEPSGHRSWKLRSCRRSRLSVIEFLCSWAARARPALRSS